MAKSKSDIDIQEKDTKVKSKSKKTKVKDEPLDSKVSQVTEPLDDVKVVEDNVQVDVEQSSIAASELAEIDCRSYSNPSNSCVYIRRKRSI